jgi:hypothetical protein
MEFYKLISAYISSEHGWAVAEQFESTFHGGELFEHQNYNAMRYILDSINKLLHADFFEEEYYDELQDYKNNLYVYITEG